MALPAPTPAKTAIFGYLLESYLLSTDGKADKNVNDLKQLSGVPCRIRTYNLLIKSHIP